MHLLATSQDNNTIFAGEGAISRLNPVLERYKHILVFNDRDGFRPCGAEAYFTMMEKQLMGHTSFHLISYAGKALPIEDIEEKYKESKPVKDVDLIIGVGGGTVIDLAKIISIGLSNGFEKAELVLTHKDAANKIPLIFIPTTAGTGSEATSFAVVYKEKIKYSIDHKTLIPTYTVLDPLLLLSLPEPILNSTILDALAQAIESFWAAGGTEESREYSKQAIKLILHYLDKNHPSSIERLTHLQWASHWAGKAINISRTTLPHSISYPITAHFGVPHGIAVFLTLPSVAKLNYSTTNETCRPGITVDFISNTFSSLFSLFEVNTIEELVEKLEAIMVRLGFKTHLRNFKIKKKDLPFIAANALTKGRSDNNPRKIDQETVLQLLTVIF